MRNCPALAQLLRVIVASDPFILFAIMKMKRTSSGSDLSHKELYRETTTPYVYMPKQPDGSPRRAGDIGAVDDPSVFRRHCGGATVKKLHTSDVIEFSLPDGFDVIIADSFLIGTELFTGNPIFSVPLATISHAKLMPIGGANAVLMSLLCSCCYGERQKLLALDFDAPIGWLQWEAAHGAGLAGPVRLGLHVLDAEEWADALGVSLG